MGAQNHRTGAEAIDVIDVRARLIVAQGSAIRQAIACLRTSHYQEALKVLEQLVREMDDLRDLQNNQGVA